MSPVGSGLEFTEVAPPGAVRGVAVVLHGGRSRGREPVRPTQPSVLRVTPIARGLVRDGAATGLAVWRVRYAVRGWNGTSASPVHDVEQVLDAVRERHPGVPVALVGYSMGGRVALRLAADPAVRVVVGLAPWVTDEESVGAVQDRHVLFAHGTRDRTTDARATAAFAARAADVAATCGMAAVRGDGHAMLRRPRLWHRLAADTTLAGLGLSAPSALLRDVLAGGGAVVEL